MPLAHTSVLAQKMRMPQSLNGITYNPVSSSFPSGPPTSGILPGSTNGVDTGLNTLGLSQQVIIQSKPRRRRRRRRPGMSSAATLGQSMSATTFGVVGHQEDSHLDRLEKKERKRPGPSSYKMPPLDSIGGKFNLSNAKSDVDWLCYHAARQPGPADYNLPPFKSNGGKFSTAFPKSDVDWLIYYGKSKPGVGAYDLDSAFHKYVGPGPEARMSAVDRGLYHEPSKYTAPKLQRKIANSTILVDDSIHRKRKQRRSFARYQPGDERRQRLDRYHTTKTLGNELHTLRKSLSMTGHGHVDRSLSLVGDGDGSTASGIGMTRGGEGGEVGGGGGGEEMGESLGSPFKHASASQLVAPPIWDITSHTNHHESIKKRGDHFVVPKQKQGGAGACWASTSAGLIFVAHDEIGYKVDKSAYRNQQVRSIVRVAPLRVPRF